MQVLQNMYRILITYMKHRYTKFKYYTSTKYTKRQFPKTFTFFVILFGECTHTYMCTNISISVKNIFKS